MAQEMVSLRESQAGMDRMSADMADMKRILMSLRPSAPTSSSLATQPVSNSTLQTEDIERHALPVSSIPTNSVGVTPDLSLFGAAGGFAEQGSLLDDVTLHIQKNTVPPPTTQSSGGYTGPTMPDLRKDAALNLVTQQVLSALEQRIPQIREHFAVAPPQPFANLGTPAITVGATLTTTTTVTSVLSSRPASSILPSLSLPSANLGSTHPAYQALLSGPGTAVQPGTLPCTEDVMDAAQIMQLCTVSNRKQLRPHEFVRLGRFSYASKITDKNITVPLFVMGYLQYVVALLKGVAPKQSETEVVDRLINLMTIMEITANNSTLEDFKSPGWSIGLEYAGRIFHDIEYGRIKWEDLSEGLQPNTFLYAKDTVDMQQGKGVRDNRGDQPRGKGARGRGGRGGGRGGGRSESFQEGNKVCQSYNGFWTGSGCAYEYNNNRKCGYEHYCSSCYEKSGTKEGHKAYYCQPDGRSSSAGGGSGSGAVKPAVTSG